MPMKHTGPLGINPILSIKTWGCHLSKQGHCCQVVWSSSHCLSSFKGQSNEYQGFLGTWWLKVSSRCDSAAYRQLDSIHKVVH